MELNVQDLSKFIFKKTLSDNPQRKLIVVEGSFEDQDGVGLLILEKKPFNEENVKLICQNKQSILKKELINDIYSSFELLPETQLNGIKATIIFPATDQHIKRFEKSEFNIVEETKEIYRNITLPFILERQLSLQWVFNILEHKSESDRIIYEDPDPVNGFILLPDLKWDGKQLETLYVLGICNARGIKSIRDLNSNHVALLEKILSIGPKIISEKYSLNKSQLRIYLHYPPSFYHLHIHFTSVDFDNTGISFDRAHSLQSVINNIKLKSDYYEESSLLFSVKSCSELFDNFQNAGLFKSTENVKRVKQYD